MQAVLYGDNLFLADLRQTNLLMAYSATYWKLPKLRMRFTSTLSKNVCLFIIIFPIFLPYRMR